MADADQANPQHRPLEGPTLLRPRRWAGFSASPPPPIGRDHDIAALCGLLRACRLVTATGPGGVGKTRLALAVAEELAAELADGAVFVALAAINDPALLFSTIAHALDALETPGRSPRDVVIRALRDERLLLILDNFEHLAGPAAATDIAALLEACPDLTILVTSRRPLHLHDEHLFTVVPLSLPAAADAADPAALAAYGAVALFVERARMTRHDFALTVGNAASVVEICRRLDGLPLAIELAAAWVRVLPPVDLLARLEPRLPLLRGGAADQPSRLRTMRDAIAWSYERLSEDERQLLRRLAIFVGGFTLDAAEVVAGGGRRQAERDPSGAPPACRLPPAACDHPDTLDVIASLVDQSLLFHAEIESAAPRFAMLETIREFALEEVRASGEADEAAARQAAWCVRLAEEVWRSGMVSQRAGLTALEAEHPNLRAALTWLLAQGETTTALHLAAELAEFWMRHGHLAEGQSWLERTLAADVGPPSAARAEALAGLSMLLWQRDDFARATRLLDEAEMAARAVDDTGMLAYARLHQGYTALWSGDYALAASRGEECLATCALIPQGFNCHGVMWLQATAALALGQSDEAAELFARLLASARAVGDEVSIANGHYGLAVLAERRGELPQALAGFVEAAKVGQEVDDHWFASHCLEAAAVTSVALDGHEPAVRLFAAGRALRAAVGATLVSRLIFEWQPQELALARARELMDARRFAAAWDAGSALSLDAAVAEAAALVRNVLRSIASARADGPSILTSRERQVLPFVIEGRSDREIAAALFISTRTASDHVGAILRKLGASTRGEAAVKAVRQGLV